MFAWLFCLTNLLLVFTQLLIACCHIILVARFYPNYLLVFVSLSFACFYTCSLFILVLSVCSFKTRTHLFCTLFLKKWSTNEALLNSFTWQFACFCTHIICSFLYTFSCLSPNNFLFSYNLSYLVFISLYFACSLYLYFLLVVIQCYLLV